MFWFDLSLGSLNAPWKTVPVVKHYRRSKNYGLFRIELLGLTVVRMQAVLPSNPSEVGRQILSEKEKDDHDNVKIHTNLYLACTYWPSFQSIQLLDVSLMKNNRAGKYLESLGIIRKRDVKVRGGMVTILSRTAYCYPLWASWLIKEYF